MKEKQDKGNTADAGMEGNGIPVLRRNVAGIDLGSQNHWVCAPTVDGLEREVEVFGATTPELERLAAWLKERNIESVAMRNARKRGEHRRVLDCALRAIGAAWIRSGAGKHPRSGLASADAEELGPDECTSASGGIRHPRRHR